MLPLISERCRGDTLAEEDTLGLSQQGITHATVLVTVAMLTSMALGIVREILIAKYFGASIFTDAYFSAHHLCHEIPVRYLANAAGGSGELNGPLKLVANATPYIFDEESLGRAVERIRQLAG